MWRDCKKTHSWSVAWWAGRSSSWRQLPTANATTTSRLMSDTFLKPLSTISAVRNPLAWWRMLPSDLTKPSPPRYSLSRMWRLTALGIVKMLEENVFQWLKMPMKTNISANVITQNSATALTAANTQTWCVTPRRMVQKAPQLLHYWRKWGHLPTLSWTQLAFTPDHASRARSPEAPAPVSPPSNATSKLHGGTWTKTTCGARAPQRRDVSGPRERRGRSYIAWNMELYSEDISKHYMSKASSNAKPFFNKVTFPMGKSLCRTLYSSISQRTSQSCLNHSQEHSKWVDADLAVLWVESRVGKKPA